MSKQSQFISSGGNLAPRIRRGMVNTGTRETRMGSDHDRRRSYKERKAERTATAKKQREKSGGES